MRITMKDATLLCDDYTHRELRGRCNGCRLSDELVKPVKLRNAKYLESLNRRIVKLRAARLATV